MCVLLNLRYFQLGSRIFYCFKVDAFYEAIVVVFNAVKCNFFGDFNINFVYFNLLRTVCVLCVHFQVLN